MPFTRLPSDKQMAVWREAGLFLCSCIAPVRVHLGAFGVDMCDRCGKKLVER